MDSLEVNLSGTTIHLKDVNGGLKQQQPKSERPQQSAKTRLSVDRGTFLKPT